MMTCSSATENEESPAASSSRQMHSTSFDDTAAKVEPKHALRRLKVPGKKPVEKVSKRAFSSNLNHHPVNVFFVHRQEIPVVVKEKVQSKSLKEASLLQPETSKDEPIVAPRLDQRRLKFSDKDPTKKVSKFMLTIYFFYFWFNFFSHQQVISVTSKEQELPKDHSTPSEETAAKAEHKATLRRLKFPVEKVSKRASLPPHQFA